jgi:hypothetical protein
MSEPKINSLEEFWVRAEQRDPDGFARSRAAEKELAALRADAERYRIWRAEHVAYGMSQLSIDMNVAWTPDAVDAAIDAARGRQA